MKKWITKDGRFLDIKDMKTDHILNALNMLKKHYISKHTFENYYGQINYLCDKPVNEFIDYFEIELQSREQNEECRDAK